ncbi:FAD dependent oxidoreductase [Aspergillus heteromorphus CBS 117.55]|uniref:FAD dependent oxidoreductase n=1 Tax=Aspergillus heteromorphus CBS 117.55 TaxID=1448321 RepID=A0A317WUW2_9EURO|nr:FAD dependent oxidoreductase [Aspergillus heteromorphus CBS 117.55]PWY90214.1 FAD dependent oxidoreductase [Aspergillus heteromorphus CBS 117.55]
MTVPTARLFFRFLFLSLFLAPLCPSHVTSQARPPETISRDVCIIGGGASGVYTAMRLRQQNISVVVIEAKGRLGGHTNTYIDPGSGTPIDFGVALFQDSSETVDFFAQLNVSLSRSMPVGGILQRIDFRTGESVAPNPGNASEALARYTAVLQRHPYLAEGWNLPDDIPEDLLMSFGQLAKKYDLGPVMETISLYTQGVRSWLDYPAVYLLKFMSLDLVTSLRQGFLQASGHGSSELYQAALRLLGGDVLLRSVVVAASRTGDEGQGQGQGQGHELTVQTEDEQVVTVQAALTILAVPPKGPVLEGFDLDAHEATLFGHFLNGHYYVGLVRVPHYPSGLQLLNRGAHTPYGLPRLPCTFSVAATAVPDIVTVSYVSEEPRSAEEVQQAVGEDILRVLGRERQDDEEPRFVAFADHSPFEMSVSREAIEGRFYDRLNGLQGHRNTFYVGATWEYPGSSPIWRAVDRLLPAIIRRLEGFQGR